MCLIDKKRVRYANHDISIFKIVLNKDGYYYSPYYNKNRLWRVNSVDFNDQSIRSIWSNPIYQEFGKGYFHAYTKKDWAYCKIAEIAKYIGSILRNGGHLEVVSGYIPEGTRYAVEPEWNEICAHKMILNI